MIQLDVYMAGRMLDRPERVEIANLAGGFTIIKTEGYWVGPDGELYDEDAYILRVISADEHVLAAVLDVAKGWAVHVGEKAVLVERSEVAARFVEL